ncbi:hypothetical protein [Nostocoides australiense]
MTDAKATAPASVPGVEPGSAFSSAPSFVLSSEATDGKPVTVGNLLISATTDGTFAAYDASGKLVWEHPSLAGVDGSVKPQIVPLSDTAVALVAEVESTGAGAGKATRGFAVTVVNAKTGTDVKAFTVPITGSPLNPHATAGLVLPPGVGGSSTVVNSNGSTVSVAPISVTAKGARITSEPGYVSGRTVVHEWANSGTSETAVGEGFGTKTWNSFTTHPVGTNPMTGQVLAVSLTGRIVAAWAPTGGTLTSGRDDAIIAVIDATTGKTVGNPLACAGVTVQGEANGVASPNGTFAAIPSVAAVNTTTGAGVCLGGTKETSPSSRSAPSPTPPQGFVYGEVNRKPVQLDLSKAPETKVEDLPGAASAPIVTVADLVGFVGSDEHTLAFYVRGN